MMPFFMMKPQASRAERQANCKRGSKSLSLLPVLVLLMIATTVTAAGLACKADAECRRNVCIFEHCTSRPLAGGACEANTHCLKSATESCINSVCSTKSDPGKLCEEPADCVVPNSVCENKECLSPSGSPCSANDQCASSLVCVNTFCSTKSLTGGDCDEKADCASSSDECTGLKCTAPAFDPSVMVWEGNKGPLNPSSQYSSSVAIGNNLFVFEGYSDGAIEVAVEAYDTLAKTWTTKTGPGIISASFVVVAVGTDVFLIGGRDGSTALTTFFSYDTTNDKWEKSWKQLPEASYAIGAAAVGSTMFVFGGYGSSNTRINTIRSLDVSNILNNWNSLTATLPVATSGLSATAINKDIYLVGGSVNPGPAVNTVYKYNTLNPTENPSSSGISPMLQARGDLMTFFDPASNRLYALGGIYFGFEDVAEYLDLSNPSGSWVSTNAPNPNYFYSNRGGLIDSLFHFISGQTHHVLDVSVPASVKWSPFPNTPSPNPTAVKQTGPTTITAVETTNTKKVSFYNTVSNTWSTGPSDFPGVNTLNSASAVVDGGVYVLGGEAGGGAGGPLGTNTVYSLSADGSIWTQQDNLPAARTRGCAAADGTNIYFYGGASNPSSAPDLTIYKMDTTKPKGSGQWTTITPVSGTPTAVMGCAAVVANGKLLIFGGGTGPRGVTPTNKIQSYDIASNSWDAPLTATITPRSFLSAVLLKGFVFLIGGSPDGISSALNKVEVFDVTAKTVTAIADMPTARFGLGSVTDGSSVFSVGGVGSSTLEKLISPSSSASTSSS